MSVPKVAAELNRIEIDVTPELKSLLERAEKLQGCTLEEFIITALMAEAEATIAGHEFLRIDVSPQAYEQIMAAITNPLPPNKELREAAQDYWKFASEAERE